MIMNKKNKELSQEFDFDRDPILTLTQPPTGLNPNMKLGFLVEDILYSKYFYSIYEKKVFQIKNLLLKNPLTY